VVLGISSRPEQFGVDCAYGSSATEPQHLFGTSVAPLVDGLFQGFNAAVMAYGQTGAGKSFTMGTDRLQGPQLKGWTPVLPQVFGSVWGRVCSLQAAGHTASLTCSFVEVYQVGPALTPRVPACLPACLPPSHLGMHLSSAHAVRPLSRRVASIPPYCLHAGLPAPLFSSPACQACPLREL
jgi:hypothetical protein